MAKFIPRRKEQILAQMIATAVARSELSDVADSATVKHILAAAARADDEIYFEMQNLLLLFSIDTAVGEDLDERAKDIQPGIIKRFLASPATGTIVFSRNNTTGTATIPIGTKVKTADGQIFTSTSSGTITPTSAEQILGHGIGRDSNSVSVVADLPGAAGNVAADTVIKFEAKPPGVDEVVNLSAFANGRDKESDDDFRQRIKDFVASLARCNVSAIEAGVRGQQDPETLATALFANVFEDIVNRGNVTLFVDDGTGTAESFELQQGTPIANAYAWDGTTTILASETEEVVLGDFIGVAPQTTSPAAILAGPVFEVIGITEDVDITISNPSGQTIPDNSVLGEGSFKNPENLTEGLSGPPVDSAVGGETRLSVDNVPIKIELPFVLFSNVRGSLVKDTDFALNPASGQVDFTPVLVTGEKVFATRYTNFTGLIEFVQKIVDGDANDRVNFPGLRAAGVLVRVLSPQVLIQTVEALVTVADGFDQVDVETAVQTAIRDHINSLNISDDVLLARLIQEIMAVPGVNNVVLDAPFADVAILDDQLARTTNTNIVVN